MSEAALRKREDVRHVLVLLSYLIIEIDVKLDLGRCFTQRTEDER